MIESLKVQNIKGVRNISVITNGNIVEIAGNNEAGKSSCMDAIAYALGGKRLCPTKPIRDGEAKGKVEVETKDFVITRKFWIDPDSKSGAYKTSIKALVKEGGTLTQTDLNAMLSGLAFDPLAISRQDTKKTIEQLKNMAGHAFVAELYDVEEAERAAFEQRTDINRRIKDMGELRAPEKAEPVDTEGLMAELDEVEKFNRKQMDTAYAIKDTTEEVSRIEASVSRLEHELSEAKSKLTGARAHLASLGSPKETKDTQPLKNRLSSAAETNAKAAAYQRYLADLDRSRELNAKAAKLTETIEAMRQKRLDLFANAKFPVPGLEFSESGLALNGIPMDQLSAAQAWKTWVRIGIATLPNPEDGELGLRIMFIKDGSLLDAKSFEILRQMAAEHDCQFWIETVGQGHGDAIMIDEGEVVDFQEWQARQKAAA